jgi:hypothetical protein
MLEIPLSDGYPFTIPDAIPDACPWCGQVYRHPPEVNGRPACEGPMTWLNPPIYLLIRRICRHFWCQHLWQHEWHAPRRKSGLFLGNRRI